MVAAVDILVEMELTVMVLVGLVDHPSTVEIIPPKMGITADLVLSSLLGSQNLSRHLATPAALTPKPATTTLSPTLTTGLATTASAWKARSGATASRAV